ncbi:Quercetin 2,3-dioxygenase [Colletotrichum tanaceti]|uniref:Quercetin 2,3-dioxygenase n=1 Tax=Colletotrichum tanaceti TaxID=1306861 RepID=A0A4U6X7N8_9PEZI|nr:Quercetin 2,3-dioxygenase [Colletotrichum tanaceti]
MRFSTLAAGLPLVAAAPKGYSFNQTNTTGKTLILDQTPEVSQPYALRTVTLSSLMSNQAANEANLNQPLAFQLEEGALNIAIDGYDAVMLIQGDIAFIPAHTLFNYKVLAAFTKFLYVSGGGGGLDYQLLQRAVPWGHAMYPFNAGFTVQRGALLLGGEYPLTESTPKSRPPPPQVGGDTRGATSFQE